MIPTAHLLDRARLIQAALGLPLEGRSDFRRSQRKVLVFLASVCGIDPERERTYFLCWPANADIADHTGISIRTVADCIKELTRRDAIRIDRVWRRREIMIGPELQRAVVSATYPANSH